METEKQIKKRQAGIRRAIEALKRGRELSLFDADEFDQSEMHTCFCYIRRYVKEGKIAGYVMKDRWSETNGIRYKTYWFEKDENIQD